MTQKVESVLVVGAGVMGVEIAAKCRLAGLRVSMYDTNARALQNVDRHSETWRLDGRSDEELSSLANAVRELSVETDAQKAVTGVDLLIEAVPENLQLKREVFRQFGSLCDPQTIFVTNTSGMVPSQMAMFSGRPERFAALHFMLGGPLIEVMGHFKTEPAILESLEHFCRSIRHVPIRCLREFPGYVSNALLFPLAQAAMGVVVSGASTVQDCDRCFMVSYRAPIGPFGYLDFVGLDTAIEVLRCQMAARSDQSIGKLIELLEPLVAEGRLGVKTQHGFYRYPDPEFAQPGFVKPELLQEDVQTATPVDEVVAKDSALACWQAFHGIDWNGPDECVATFRLNPDQQAFLRDHEYRGCPILPAAAMLVLAKHSVNAAWPNADVGALHNFRIANGLRFFTERDETVHIRMKKSSASGTHVDCTLTYEFRNRSGKLMDGARPLATVTAGARQSLPRSDRGSTVSPTHRVTYLDDSAMYRWGSSMRGLVDVEFGHEQVRGIVTCFDGERDPRNAATVTTSNSDDAGTAIHREIALIDGTLMASACHELITAGDQILVPQGIQSISFGRSPAAGEACQVDAIVGQRGEDGSRDRVDTYGADGETLLRIDGYLTTQVPLTGTMPISIDPVGATPMLKGARVEGDAKKEPAWDLCTGVNESNGGFDVTFRLHPTECGFLFGHQFRQTPLLPLTGIFELTRYALGVAFPNKRFTTFHDIDVVNGLRFFGDTPDVVTVHLAKDEKSVTCELRHDFCNRAGKLIQPNRTLTRFVATTDDASLHSGSLRHSENGLVFDIAFRDDLERTFFLGPEMRGLQSVVFSDEAGCGSILPPDEIRSRVAWQRGITVLDSGLCACNAHTQNRLGNGLQIPQKVEAVRFGRHAGADERCRVDFEVTRFDDAGSLMQLVIRGEDDALIAEFKNYQCAVMTTPDGPIAKLKQVDSLPVSAR